MYQCGHAGYRATVQGQYIHGEHFVGRHQPSVCQASTQDRQTNYVHVEEDSDPRDGARQEDDGEVADDVEDFGFSDEDEVVDSGGFGFSRKDSDSDSDDFDF